MCVCVCMHVRTCMHACVKFCAYSCVCIHLCGCWNTLYWYIQTKSVALIAARVTNDHAAACPVSVPEEVGHYIITLCITWHFRSLIAFLSLHFQLSSLVECVCVWGSGWEQLLFITVDWSVGFLWPTPHFWYDFVQPPLCLPQWLHLVNINFHDFTEHNGRQHPLQQYTWSPCMQ